MSAEVPKCTVPSSSDFSVPGIAVGPIARSFDLGEKDVFWCMTHSKVMENIPSWIPTVNDLAQNYGAQSGYHSIVISHLLVYKLQPFV